MLVNFAIPISVMQEKYYLTVEECPLISWRKANDGDLVALRRDKGNGNEIDDQNAWEILYNDFIREFGLNQDFKDYLELVQEKIRVTNEFIQTRNRWLLNDIGRLEHEISQFNKTAGKGLTIDEILPKMTKYFGVHLRERDLTVREYFKYLKEFQDGRK